MILIATVVFYIKRKPASNNPENASEKKLVTNKKIISNKTEKEFLANLIEFEESEDFLNKDISMSALIVRFNTNSKYFRVLLKKLRNKDFNNYINELRINYIANKLKTDSKYLSYKISYLAEESGFTSHSKFSADFKRILDQSPSEFINNIKTSNSLQKEMFK